MRYALCRAAPPCLKEATATSSVAEQRLFCWDGFWLRHGSAVRADAQSQMTQSRLCYKQWLWRTQLAPKELDLP